MDRAITYDDARELLAAGFAIVEDNSCAEVPHVTVADPVICLSGGRRWSETKEITLRSRGQVSRFLIARS